MTAVEPITVLSGAAGAEAHDARYVPGTCNIGPDEIAARRRWGHAGTLASVVLFGVLVARRAPPWARLLLAVPVGGAASGYLQARFRFCASFAARGVYNFGAVGPVEVVTDRAARSADRVRAIEIGLASLAVGLVAGAVAALLPIRRP